MKNYCFCKGFFNGEKQLDATKVHTFFKIVFIKITFRQ